MFPGVFPSSDGWRLRFRKRATELSVGAAPYTGRVRTWCLSFHAAYRCRHSGDCCRAEWDIDVEPRIVDAVRSGRVVPLRSTAMPFAEQPGGGAAALARTSAGECAFHNHQRCSLQEAGTESMLPTACRHFPRVFLRDARGCLVTLSHYCPTAAAMLLDESPVEIVEARRPLALDEPIEGLDARDALPPLVRPGMLADVDGYAAWEQAVVRTLLAAPDVGSALAAIDRATEIVRRWLPSDGPLSNTVAGAFETPLGVAQAPPLSRPFAMVREETGPHPLMAVPDAFDARWHAISADAGQLLRGPVARYLAACAFGNWIAYRGQGLRSVAAWLRACHDVLRVQLVTRLGGAGPSDPAAVIESIRMADYIMVHTADTLAFGRAAAALERVAG